jgi:hypothetical protein
VLHRGQHAAPGGRGWAKSMVITLIPVIDT